MQNKKIVKTFALLNGVLLSSVALSAPQFYGKFSLGVVNTQDVATKRVWKIENQASRIGFKGNYLANSDIDLIYQLELGLNPADSSKPLLSMRNSFLGVQGKWGEVIAGTFDTPLKSIQGKVDLFNDTTFDMSNLMSGEVRHQQSLQYSTGKLMDNVTIKLNWLPSDVKNQDDGVSASLDYQAKRWSAALALDSHVAGDGGVVTSKVNALNTARTVWMVKASDAVQLGFLAQYSEGIEADKSKELAWLLSTAWKINQFTLKTQLGQALGRKDNTGASSDAKISQLTLGLDYAIAKNTTAFAYTGVERYENGAGGLVGQQKANRSSVGFGMSYQF